MKENIKIGLLAIIALTLIIQVATDDHDAAPTRELAKTKPASNLVSPNNNITDLSPGVTEPAKPVGPTTSISFPVTEHNFGKIKQDSENRQIFTFTNTGNEPLIIETATGSCGCTVPEYPKEPIAPGETGEINVVYKPGKQKGSQTKTVTITANTEPKQTKLFIKAEVEEVAS